MSEGFEDVRDLYQAVVLRHGRDPVHQRRLDPFDAAARGENPMCGDRVEVRVRFGAAGTVAEAAFEARGCAISVASADLMAGAVPGRTPDELRALAVTFADMARTGVCPDCLGDLRALSGVHDYPSRIRCATLPWTALVQALDEAPDVSAGAAPDVVIPAEAAADGFVPGGSHAGGSTPDEASDGAAWSRQPVRHTEEAGRG